MILEIKIPSPGESITEVELTSWFVSDGDQVKKDQEIAEVESDKATLPLIAEEGGKISLKTEEGSTIEVGSVAATIDTGAKGREADKETSKSNASTKEAMQEDNVKEEKTKSAPEPGIKEKEQVKEQDNKENKQAERQDDEDTSRVKISPLAREKMKEYNLSVGDVLKGLKRITREEVEMVNNSKEPVSPVTGTREASREEKREKMSMLRKKLSKRLVAVKNETAMLTTFNEVDMSEVIALRKKYQKSFVEKHGIKLGFMSFFTKAVTETLLTFPKVNSLIDNEEIVTPMFVDVGIAVQTAKGLMVPVLRNTERMSLAEIENKIAELAAKARKFRLSVEEMSGGTFTITNGGIFGSLLSTPVLNPPQAAILGMHNILERPVAINGKVEIRPMMYLALSYDHRIIDGKDSVTFLVKLKEFIESPYKLLFGGEDPEKKLLDI